MNNLLTLIVIFVILTSIYAGDAYGQRQQQVAASEHPSLPEVSLQLQLRNSEGQLITYIEPTTMYIINIFWVHQFLDTIENKTIIEKDGQMVELIQYEQTARFSKVGQYATYGMVDKGNYVITFRHDGYLSSPGDTLDVSWKIIRTIQ